MDMGVRQLDEDASGWGPLSRLPGNPLMWVLIWSELLVFGAGLASYGVARMLQPDLFDASQAQLDRVLGGVNTLVLLTSGLFAAMAVRVRAEGNVTPSRVWMMAAMAVGAVFLVVKVVEYDAKFSMGIGMETNTFFTLYFLITGFHFMHVILGLVILGIVTWKNSLTNLETGAAFWHMVDLIWVLIYPIMYLLR